MDYAEKLRDCTETGADPEVLFEAADEIDRLRAALQEIADHEYTGRLGWRHWKDMACDALDWRVGRK